MGNTLIGHSESITNTYNFTNATAGTLQFSTSYQWIVTNAGIVVSGVYLTHIDILVQLNIEKLDQVRAALAAERRTAAPDSTSCSACSRRHRCVLLSSPRPAPPPSS